MQLQLKELQLDLSGKQESLQEIQDFAAQKDSLASSLRQLKNALEDGRKENKQELQTHTDEQRRWFLQTLHTMENEIEQTTKSLATTLGEGKSIKDTKKMMMETERLSQEEIYQLREERKLRETVVQEQEIQLNMASKIRELRQSESIEVNNLLEYRKMLVQMRKCMHCEGRAFEEADGVKIFEEFSSPVIFTESYLAEDKIKGLHETTILYQAATHEIKKVMKDMKSLRPQLVIGLCEAAKDLFTGPDLLQYAQKYSAYRVQQCLPTHLRSELARTANQIEMMTTEQGVTELKALLKYILRCEGGAGIAELQLRLPNGDISRKMFLPNMVVSPGISQQPATSHHKNMAKTSRPSKTRVKNRFHSPEIRYQLGGINQLPYATRNPRGTLCPPISAPTHRQQRSWLSMSMAQR